jgi:hypothetical protein
LEDTALKERREGFEHGGWCRSIALARVDPEQPAFIVIEVEKIEGHAAGAGRRDLKLPAAMREAPQPGDCLDDGMTAMRQIPS